MAKGNIIEDTFEKAVEQSTTAGKKTVKSVLSTVSPTKIWEELLGIDNKITDRINAENSKAKNKSHTPLNFDQLAKTYKDRDTLNTEKLKLKLFQLVKKGEEEEMAKEKQADKKRNEEEEFQNKKKEADNKKKFKQNNSLPLGKIRKSIFSPKKMAKREHTEFKPSSGKQ